MGKLKVHTKNRKSEKNKKIAKKVLCKCLKSQPSYGLPNTKTKIWCKKCPDRPPNAIDLSKKKCVCQKRTASYHEPNGKNLWCAVCPTKPATAIQRNNRLCRRCKLVNGSFNLPGEKPGIWCKDCKDDNAVNVVSKMCIICDETRPIYALPGEKTAKWCLKCKPTNAVDIKHKKCICGAVRPSFALAGQKPIWCTICPTKDKDAVNIVDPDCECGQAKAYYNIPGNKSPLWCYDCKSDDAIAVKKRICECGEHEPSFGLPEDRIRIWCNSCPTKPKDAIDVTNALCKCGTSASYGIPGSSVTCCSTHKISGMVTLPTKKCEFSQCKELALFGSKDRQRCDTHKLATDLNLVEKPCISCGLDNVLNANKKCYFCEPNTFLRIQKQKETRIRDFLIANNIPFTQDKIPNGTECGKEKPDFVIYFTTHVIIIEVDENQHKGYVCECEQIRMINLTQSFSGLPVFWIRYNPDVFKLPNEKKSKISQSNREEHLLDWINFASIHIPTHLGQVVYLFFDGCNEKQGEENIVVLPVL
jgi:hypothetical protein